MSKKDNSDVKVGFKKEIGLWGGISIIGGIMIGSGIFYLGTQVLERAHMSMGLALIAWIVGGLVSILGGLCFAELGAARPEAGGMVVYLDEAYHPCIGYSFAFTSMLISGAGSIAAISIALPEALRAYIGLSDIQVKIFAVIFIVLLTIYNCYGVKLSNILQSMSMAAKLIPIALIIAGALVMGRQDVNLSLQPMDGTGELGLSGVISTIAFATVASLWAYEGWTNLNSMAEEMKNPKRDLPLALIFGIGGVMVIYTVFNFAIYRMLPVETINSMIASGDEYLGTEVARRVFGNVGGVLVVIAMVIAMFSSNNGMIIAFPRMYYAMAQGGHFFKPIAKLDPKTHVPVNSMILQAVISSILVCLRNLSELTAMVVFVGMVYNLLVVISVIKNKKKYPDLPRPYKAWGYPVTVIISSLLFTALCINTLIEDPITAIIGFVVPVIGIILYFVFDRRIKKDEKEVA